MSTTNILDLNNRIDALEKNAAAIAGLTASDVAYDNTTSGLTATDVQGALDEVVNYEAYTLLLTGFETPLTIEKVGRIVSITYNGNITALSAGSLTFTETLPAKFRPLLSKSFVTDKESAARLYLSFSNDGSISGHNYGSAISTRTNCRLGTLTYISAN